MSETQESIKTSPGDKTWAEQWKEATKRRKCFICNEVGYGHHFIECVECTEAFHKKCIDPLKMSWDKNEKYICDACGCICQICEEVKDDDEINLLMCDYCNRGYHMYCLDPPLEKMLLDDEEWFCPECDDEIASDEEYFEECDEHDEEWTRSECECKVCDEMNKANDTWKDFKPTTGVERCIKNSIDAAEDAPL